METIHPNVLVFSRFGQLRDDTSETSGLVRVFHRLSGRVWLVSRRVANVLKDALEGSGETIRRYAGSDHRKPWLQDLINAGLLVECRLEREEVTDDPLWNTQLVAAPLSVDVHDESTLIVQALDSHTYSFLTIGALEFALTFYRPALVGEVARGLYGAFRSREREDVLELVKQLISNRILIPVNQLLDIPAEDMAFLRMYVSSSRPPVSETYLQNTPPPLFKQYKGASVPLSALSMPTSVSVQDAIRRRRSRRLFSPEPATLEQISSLLELANGFQGIIDGRQFGPCALTTSPSAGSRHPLEIYVAALRVEGLSAGIYHHDLSNHTVVEVRRGDACARNILQSLMDIESPDTVAAVLIITAMFRRTTWKYGARACRFVYLDAGHLGQNIYLAAESVGLGVCAVGGWHEDALKTLLDLDAWQERVVHALILGRPRVQVQQRTLV